MRKLIMLVLTWVIFVGFGLISCSSNPTPCLDNASLLLKSESAQTVRETPHAERVDAAALMEKGEKCLESGDYATGLKIFQEVLSALEENDKNIGGVYYDIACAYSLMKEKAPALEFLKRAVQHGYNDYGWMGKDADLNFLHDIPEFKDLLKEMSKITEVPPTVQDIRDEQEAVKLIEETHKLKFKEMPKFKILTPEQFAKSFGRNDDSIQGFYRWDDKTLYLKQGLDPVKFRGTRIHETFHALQDQLFGLGELHRNAKTTDEKNTVLAVIEGDATLIFIECMPESMAGMMITSPNPWRTMSGKPVDTADAAMRIFNYSIGTRFIKAVKDARGWSGANAIYNNLPSSSEQILHPEKYLQQNDPPMTVVIPDLNGVLGADWKISNPDAKGEFSILVDFLMDSKTRPVAHKASEGWGGDSFIRVQNKSQKTVFAVHKSVWDTPKDAQEFYDAVNLSLDEASQLEKGDNYVCCNTSDNKVYHAMIKDSTVLVVYDIPLELKDKVVKVVIEKK